MNRRKFISSAGIITLGGGVGLNILSRSSLAFESKINNKATIPENIKDPKVNLNFESFKVTVQNIEKITIKLNAALKGNDLIKNIDSLTENLDNKNGVNNLDNISLVLSEDSTNGIDLKNKLDTKTEGDILELTIEIIVENTAVGEVSTGKKNITIPITSPEVSDSTGGQVDTKTIDGKKYRIHSFKTAGSHTFSIDAESEIDILIIGGGGGGGTNSGGAASGGGGGAGGLVFEKQTVGPGDYSIYVGEGGAGETSLDGGFRGENGEDSTAFNLTAIGGGGGGGRTNGEQKGADGGSGGGASSQGYSGGTSLQSSSTSGGYGYDGGDSDGSGGSSSNEDGGAGGGGAAEKGGYGQVNSSAGNGGDGRYYGDVFGDSFGENGYFAGGGGGGQTGGYSKGSGGIGGGGDGGKRNNPASDAQEGTGGGGGGGANDIAGDGANGQVLIRVGPI